MIKIRDTEKNTRQLIENQQERNGKNQLNRNEKEDRNKMEQKKAKGINTH